MPNNPPRKNIIDKVAQLFFASDKGNGSSYNGNTERRHQGFRSARRFTPVVFSLLLLAMFVFAGWYYASTQNRIESNSLVTNLTTAKLETKIRFGNSPQCTNGPCWADPNFNDSSWQSAKLPLDPSASINTLDGYQVGLDSGWMFYRMTIPVSTDLQNQPDEISFTPLFIQHKKYFVYLNSRLVFSGDGIALGRIANLPIPRQDILNGSATFVIKASVLPGDIGIAHYHSMLVGPKPILDQVYLFNQHSQYTYYLLFMLSKGSIFVIFALIFLYTRGQPGFLNFLGYGFFTTIENLFIGDFLYSEDMLSLSQRVLAFYSCKALALASLLAFFVNFFQARPLRRPALIVGSILVIVTAIMAYNFGWGTKSVSFAELRAITNNSLVCVIAFAIILGLLAIRQWRRFGAEGTQLNTYKTFSIFLGVYFLLILDEFYFKTYKGFDKRALLDLAFFLVLALITARDMGSKEGKIITLEGHMNEKRRMEMELQEAAEIAKVFIPTSTPHWAEVAIETFHQPLTESSGDWYSFEQSGDGSLYHFVMCDITGHGVQAAIVVSTCRSVLGSMVRGRPESIKSTDFIANFASELNATLFENGSGFHVSTLLGLTFEPRRQKLHYLLAGHPPPLLIRQNQSGAWQPKALVSRNNVLGIKPQFDGILQTVEFRPRDQLITYTDGLPIGSNIKALRRFLHEYEARGQDNAVVRLQDSIWAAEAARTKGEPGDDISIVWFKGVA